MGEGMDPENGPFFLKVFCFQNKIHPVFFPIVSSVFFALASLFKGKARNSYSYRYLIFPDTFKTDRVWVGKKMLPRLNRRDSLHGWEFDV